MSARPPKDARGAIILLTVGTTDFDELVRAVDVLAPGLPDQVVAQIGRGTYEPCQMKYFRFAPSLDDWYSRAKLVIAHGGLGTAIEVLQRGLPLVAVSNPDRYDRHQDDLLRAFEERGHLLWCRDLRDLGGALRAAASMSFTPYTTPACHIAQKIRAYLGLRESTPG